jgi:hypothetical protein
MYQHLPFQDPAKFTQIGIFGLKIFHLAALLGTVSSKETILHFRDDVS